MKTADQLHRERLIGIIISVAVVSLGLAGWLTLRFVLGFSLVPTGSMAPTVHPGDRVTLNRAAYLFGTKPRVGEIASYWTLTRERYLHRIVGGPGDTLELRNNVLFRNGSRVDEPYIMITPEVPAVRTFGPVTVPPGHYFFLGDNRDNSNDSRFLGFIAESDIRGRMGRVLHLGECQNAQ